MKRQILLYTTLFFSSLFIQTDPLLVAVLMVKDEAHVMQSTLQPLVDAGIDAFFIYDTGSSDNTMQVTKDFFAHNNITNFGIAQEPWIDFGASRSKALRLTEQFFPQATFMLMLDAEWQLQNGAELLKFCEQQKNDTTPIYLTRITESIDAKNDFMYASLIRCGCNIYYVGKVYEIPNILSDKQVPNHIYIKKTRTSVGKEKSEKRWLKDIEILLQEIADNPNDARSAFFLAATYFCLHDWQNSIQWHEKCLTMPNFSEEDRFTILYTLAKSYDFSGNEEKMLYYYVQAFNQRPFRAEPIIRLAIYYYNKGNYIFSYLLAQYAATIPYPEHEMSAVEKELYDTVRYEILSRVAWTHQAYELGKYSAQKALDAYPDNTYLREILNYYQEKLQE